MEFRKATDELFEKLDHETLAKALGVSVATIRQARLKPDANAHRTPPRDWEKTVISLAEQRVRHYRQLIDTLRNSRQP